MRLGNQSINTNLLLLELLLCELGKKSVNLAFFTDLLLALLLDHQLLLLALLFNLLLFLGVLLSLLLQASALLRQRGLLCAILLRHN